MMVSERLAGAEHDRIYAIGDVHGHVDKLRAVHDAIRADLAESRPRQPLLVHLGDYVDRGQHSNACLALLAHGAPVDGVPTVCLMGNHERMMLDALRAEDDAAIWLRNGGDETLRSFGADPAAPWARWREQVPPAALQFMDALPLWHAAGRFLFVHAGVRPGVRLDRQSANDLLWIREEFLGWPGTMLPDAPGRIVVHGHTPETAPVIRRNRIGLDTNAARGGKLTCAVLQEDSVYFLQV